MKINKIFLVGDVESNIHKHIVDNINIRNVNSLYQLAKLFNLFSLAKPVFMYIERFFTMLVETESFLELDYTCITNILASSGLLLTSELEVYNAGNLWLGHNINERSKFAKDILLKVRLSLLSREALKFLLNKSSSFRNNDACKATIEEILEAILNNKDQLIQNSCISNYTNRYCDQDSYNILICGGYDHKQKINVNTVKQMGGKQLEYQKVLPSMIKGRQYSKAVCLNGDVYLLGGHDNNNKWTMSVEKYSHFTNTWNKVGDISDDRQGFSVCAFMDKIVVIGGGYFNKVEAGVTDTCLMFETKERKWKEVARMNGVRYRPASAVFEGRVIVSGGRNYDLTRLNTVESYDVIVDKWSTMPSMISSKCNHSLAVVKDKLFVIGNGGCEVFDKCFKKFVAIKSPQTSDLYLLDQAISIGSKIIAIQLSCPSIFCYDVDTTEWLEESCEVTKNLNNFSCVKIPCF